MLDVLVIGAGPTGLTLASELLRHGASVRVLEQLEEPPVWSRAAAVHARTMEIFDDMGLSSDVLAHAKPLAGIRIFDGERLVGKIAFDTIESHFPHVYGISQRETEHALARHLSSLGGAVERKKKVVALAPEADRVRATVDDGETVEARWVVGCDGAHSMVRKELGFSFEGHPYDEHVMQADVHVDFPGRGAGDEIHLFMGSKGPLAMFPLFQDGRYRLIVVLGADEPDVEPTLEAFQRFVDERGPKDAVVRDPAWMVPFRIHCRRSERYRKGRVFIAGDAAHIHSPVGGQGMNTGIQDAYNLAWKLALVARGRAPDSLLDSYETERLPIAEQLLAATDTATRGMAFVAMLESRIAARVRDEILGFVTGLDAFRARMTANVAMLEIRYPKSPIVAEDRPALLRTNVLGGAADEAPGLRDRAAFGGGPAPGDRAPDVDVADGAPRVGELLRGTKHVLFLFDGASATPEGYAKLTKIATRVRDAWGELVKPYVVVPRADEPAALRWEGSMVFDVRRAMHERYGARSECLYLVRPDGYVAYRCQPADGEKLEAYLRSVLTAP